jgi:hypothetical protein
MIGLDSFDAPLIGNATTKYVAASHHHRYLCQYLHDCSACIPPHRHRHYVFDMIWVPWQLASRPISGGAVQMAQ